MIRDQGCWQILTGEYPPQIGGVADYTRQIACGLADAGEDVHVWAPFIAEGKEAETYPGVTVHREARGWSRRGLARIGQALERFEFPRQLLLQYAPNAFGRRGLNFGLARWLAERRQRGDIVRVMFHEVSYFVKPGDSLARRSLAFAQRRLATRLLGAADRVDVAIPYWDRMLRPLDPVPDRSYTWLPVASNVPVIDDPESIRAIRGSQTLTRIGSFGTFASDVTSRLAEAMIPLLRSRPDRVAVLIGRGGDQVAETWVRTCPELAGRIFATGLCELDDISRFLQSCDLLLQPYPGGVCSKRTTLMAGLAHGLATVTTSGEVTESIWADVGATAIAPENDATTLIAMAEALLTDDSARIRLGEAGRALYEQRFALRHTIDALIAEVLGSTLSESPFS